MFDSIRKKLKEAAIRREQAMQAERVRLQSLSEKELLIEILLELKRIYVQCDEIGRKIVIWSN